MKNISTTNEYLKLNQLQRFVSLAKSSQSTSHAQRERIFSQHMKKKYVIPFRRSSLVKRVLSPN